MGQRFLNRYRASDNPQGERLPTPEELLQAVEQPAKAEPWLIAYLETHPEYAEYLRMVSRYKARVGEGPKKGD